MTLADDARTRQSREDLKQEFQDEEYRYAYAEDFLNTWIAAQIVTLREQRRMSQADFGELIGTKQPGVSRLENVNHSTWKTETLKRIARALGVRLSISFETFGSLMDDDARFCRESLERPEFKDDPAFSETIKEPPAPGHFIVSDPSVCHGQPTFRGTRILVADVLDQVVSGMSWETIVEEWRGRVPREAIAEAVRVASRAFFDHSSQYAETECSLEPTPA